MDKIKALFSKAGQCLFLTQRIESMFKFIFPFVSDDVDPKPPADLEVFTHRKEFVESKTLGYVIKLLKEKEFGLCQRTSAIISEFIDMRNKFVHNIFSPSNFSLTSHEDFDKLSNFLDKYLVLINSINDMFEPVMLCLFDIIISGSQKNLDSNKINNLLNNVIFQRSLSIENQSFINIDAFFGKIAEARSVTKGRHVNKREVWEETAIIKALYKAIEECDTEDEGWVLLSSCATKMSSHTQLKKDHYGFNKLSELIQASELFELCNDKYSNAEKTQVKIKRRFNTV